VEGLRIEGSLTGRERELIDTAQVALCVMWFVIDMTDDSSSI
jgi:hypothetical protein